MKKNLALFLTYSCSLISSLSGVLIGFLAPYIFVGAMDLLGSLDYHNVVTHKGFIEVVIYTTLIGFFITVVSTIQRNGIKGL